MSFTTARHAYQVPTIASLWLRPLNFPGFWSLLQIPLLRQEWMTSERVSSTVSIDRGRVRPTATHGLENEKETGCNPLSQHDGNWTTGGSDEVESPITTWPAFATRHPICLPPAAPAAQPSDSSCHNPDVLHIGPICHLSLQGNQRSPFLIATSIAVASRPSAETRVRVLDPDTACASQRLSAFNLSPESLEERGPRRLRFMHLNAESVFQPS